VTIANLKEQHIVEEEKSRAYFVTQFPLHPLVEKVENNQEMRVEPSLSSDTA
jgi:hypothetical protein